MAEQTDPSPVAALRAQLEALKRFAEIESWEHADFPTARAGFQQIADRLSSLLRVEQLETLEPEVPHLREDYREVWLSGWRAGVSSLLRVEGIERPTLLEQEENQVAR